ncbi:MAG: hypothetical protein AAF479_05950 [Pseudomonadota bacterium]
MADQLGTGFKAFLETAAASDVYAEHGNILSGGSVNVSREDIDVTQVSETVRRMIPGLASNGTINLTYAYDASIADQAAWATEVRNGPTANGRRLAIYHTGMDVHWILSGYATNWAPGDHAPGQHMTATLTFRVNACSEPISGEPATS